MKTPPPSIPPPNEPPMRDAPPRDMSPAEVSWRMASVLRRLAVRQRTDGDPGRGYVYDRLATRSAREAYRANYRPSDT